MKSWIRMGLAATVCMTAALTGCAGADRDGDPVDGTDNASEDAITQRFELTSCSRVARKSSLIAPEGGAWVPPGRTKPVYPSNDSIKITLPFQFANHTGAQSFHFHAQAAVSNTEGTRVLATFRNGNGVVLKQKSMDYFDGEFDVTDRDVPQEATSYSLTLTFYGSNGERADISWSAECTLS